MVLILFGRVTVGVFRRRFALRRMLAVFSLDILDLGDCRVGSPCLSFKRQVVDMRLEFFAHQSKKKILFHS